MKMEQTEYSELLAIKLQTPENNPKENKQHSKHGESLTSPLNSSTILLAHNFISSHFFEDYWSICSDFTCNKKLDCHRKNNALLQISW
jgi:hypothetical protein